MGRRKASTCAACNVEFLPLDSHGMMLAKDRRWPFCSPLCAKAKYLVMISMGEAIVDLRDDGVVCLICKRHLECSGTHFTRIHGLDTTQESTFTERQAAYGLPQGSRLESLRLREMKSRRAIESGFASRGGERNAGKKPNLDRRPMATTKRSAAHLAVMHKFIAGGQKHCREVRGYHAAPRTQVSLRHCPTCGRDFFRSIYNDARFCSMKCRPRNEKVIEMLRGYTQRAHSEAQAAKTRSCEHCGTVFIPARKKSAGVRFCSSRCVMQNRYVGREPKLCTAPGCDRTDRIVHGLCSMHYQRRKNYGSLSKPAKETKHCAEDACTKPAKAHGLCSMHYQRWLKRSSLAT